MNNEPVFNAWVTCPKPSPRANVRLFCFPYAGGAASFFYPWAVELAPSIEVCPIQYPGRENRMFETPFTQLAPLVESLAPVIRPFLNRPFAMYGHSMGALIAFELLRQLRRLQAPAPRALFVSACPAPPLAHNGPDIHHLPNAEFLAAVRVYNGIPEAVLKDKELLELILPIVRADFTLYEKYAYAPEPPLEVPILAFGGLQDAHVSREALQAWREQTRGSFALRMFPGDHFFLQGARSLLLQSILRDVQRLTFTAPSVGDQAQNQVT